MFINNFSIKGKLAVLVLLPVLALLYFSGLAIVERQTAHNELQKLYTLSSVGVLIGDFVHEAQKERGMSAGYLGSKGQKFSSELPAQHSVTDARLNQLNEAISNLNVKDYGSEFESKIRNLLQDTSKLKDMRNRVKSLNISTPEALSYYTNTIEESLEIVAFMMHLSPNSTIVLKVGSYVNFLQAKEKAGIERAVLTNTFAADRFAENMYERFIGLITAQNSYLAVFESMSTEQQRTVLKQALQHSSINEVEQMRQIAMSKYAQGEFGVDETKWFSAITLKIDQLRIVEESLSQDIQTTAQEFLTTTQTQFYTFLVIVLLLAGLVILATLKILRSILNPVNQLKTAMETVVRTGEFRHNAKIDQQDEIGQMGKAFNNLLESMQNAIGDANATVGALAQGDFSKRIERQYVGDFDMLKEGINGSADNVTNVMRELSRVMQALHEGQFNVEVNTNAQGEYHSMLKNTAEAMALINGVVGNINKVMDAMQQGEFQQRVSVDARGELDLMKQRINNSMQDLDSAMSEITRVVVAQSDGDLTNSISTEYKGGLETLKQAVNISAEKLVEVVSKAVDASNIVSSAAKEVSQGSADLSRSVQQQAAALEQTSATMDEMNSAVQNNTENARQTAKVAQEVQTKASEGATVMQQTIVAMNSIQESSHKISDIVLLIDGIAFQTNLLALNAAVEAARAGDHGRGFAVVAGEVRALAQKSAEAAKDIKGLIDESVTRIDEGTKLASQSGEVLQGITQSVDEVADMIGQIAQASSEQSEGIKQVHNAIAQIDGVTQQNAGLVEETNAASESLSDQARLLQEDMAFFNTGKSVSSVKALPKTLQVKSAAQMDEKPSVLPTPAKPEHQANTSEWSEF